MPLAYLVAERFSGLFVASIDEEAADGRGDVAKTWNILGSHLSNMTWHLPNSMNSNIKPALVIRHNASWILFSWFPIWPQVFSIINYELFFLIESRQAAAHQQGPSTRKSTTLSDNLFPNALILVGGLGQSDYINDDTKICHEDVQYENPEPHEWRRYPKM